MSEFKESQKMKVVKLHEWTPKQFLSPTLNPKSQNNPKFKSKSNVRIEGDKENEIYCTI